jgi:hypothetical protein
MVSEPEGGDPESETVPSSRWLFTATTSTPKKSSTQCFISVLVNPIRHSLLEKDDEIWRTKLAILFVAHLE